MHLVAALVWLFLAVTLLGSVAGDEMTDCLARRDQLVAAIQDNRLFLVGILNSSLILITNSDHSAQKVYEFPLSTAMTAKSVNLYDVSPIFISKKWPWFFEYSDLMPTIVSILSTSTRAIAITGAGPMLLMPTTNNTLTFSNINSLLPIDTQFPELTNLDAFSFGFDPPFIRATRFWQNAKEVNQLMSSMWLSSSKFDRFYLLMPPKTDSTSERFTIWEWGTLEIGSTVLYPTSLRLYFCPLGRNLTKVSFSRFDAVLPLDCEIAFPWMSGVTHGFTDHQWFRMFGTEKVYVFEHQALVNLTTHYKLFEIPYKKFFICEKPAGDASSVSDPKNITILVTGLVFLVVLTAFLIWCIRRQRRRVSRNLSKISRQSFATLKRRKSGSSLKLERRNSKQVKSKRSKGSINSHQKHSKESLKRKGPSQERVVKMHRK